MPVQDLSLIDDIRASSRRMVRELGFLHTTLAATDYQASAVHALLEIDSHQAMTAAQLSDVLGLEKSTVSRMVRKLIDAGELREKTSAEDGRAKLLSLTAKGRKTCAAIQAYARTQVSTALDHLSADERAIVSKGLSHYAQALEAQRQGETPPSRMEVRIEQGYRPGVIGRVAEMHGNYYSRYCGFGQFFEGKVAAGIAEFTGRLASPRNGLWAALQDERIVGSVAIDGEDLGNNMAHLRWFIIDDGFRGSGLGRRLMSEAMAFCDAQQFAETQLWTFKGLDAARRLYEDFGFVLAEEWLGTQWGSEVTEQRFVRKAGLSSSQK
jgi:DNA-binding MarR family transcriptional regulator/GNAT superfamily N-acetyltransferase